MFSLNMIGFSLKKIHKLTNYKISCKKARKLSAIFKAILEFKLKMEENLQQDKMQIFKDMKDSL